MDNLCIDRSNEISPAKELQPPGLQDLKAHCVAGYFRLAALKLLKAAHHAAKDELIDADCELEDASLHARDARRLLQDILEGRQ